VTAFLQPPSAPSPAAQRLYDEDVEELGFVMNVSRLWAHQPEAFAAFVEVLTSCVKAGGLSVRDRGILVTACASTVGDSYCSLMWGKKLAAASDVETATSVLRGDDERLTPEERAMARWARQVTRDPNGTTAADVQTLRDAGFTDTRIFAITVFIGFRLAFSAINDSLGALPDAPLRHLIPRPITDAVTYGRPFDEA
jgi:uncharacterized peroxidase-related enzyme